MPGGSFLFELHGGEVIVHISRSDVCSEQELRNVLNGSMSVSLLLNVCMGDET